MAEDGVPDLLIFSKRIESVSPKPAMQQKQVQQQKPAPKPKPQLELIYDKPEPELELEYIPHSQQKAQAKVTQPKPQALTEQVPKPVRAPMAEREEIIRRPTSRREVRQSEKLSKASLTVGESLRLAKDQFCINHPWRHAYAVCSVCKLPYCYIDIMEDQGKIYCLNDINKAMGPSNVQANPAVNFFSILSSVIFLANSAVLGYFMYPQAKFLAETALNSGLASFIFTISNTYYIPLGNIILALFGVLAAITVLRKSFYGFGFSLMVSFTGLMLVLYEYLNSNVLYLFISSTLLLLSLVSMTYSRMSSSREIAEDQVLVPDIEWPKPETF